MSDNMSKVPDDAAGMSEDVPKKQALMDIIKAMKGLKIEKMKGYTSKTDEEPSVQVEMSELDKNKDPSKDANSLDDLGDDEEEE